jgi:cob(I)alamin adenosyltransferase
LTRIYTKGGDKGETSLGDGARVPKNDARVAAFGTVDEANACVGLARLHTNGEADAMLMRIQNDLFDAGADLATPIVEKPERPPLRITESYIERLEQWCDQYNETLPALTSFILPGGTALSALLHVARTVARRAERSAWIAVNAHPDTVSPLPARYLNRVSDLLFILARVANSGNDVLWKPGGAGGTEK